MAETPKEIRVAARRRPTLLDRALLGATVTLLVCGAASCFLGVYRLADLVF
jgi:hypothetical protein